MTPALLVRCAGLALLALALDRAAGEEQPYQNFSEKGAGFYGPGRELEAPDSLSAVHLGLTGPSTGAAGAQLRQGVELALEEANAAGGYRGLPYEIVFRPDDGPWGAVAQQVVRLAHEDRVWAVIGSLDGERAHAAELVAAKLWVPVVTPGAGDLTIDYANVPWMFRLLPDDRSQADLLLGEARRNGWKRLVLATEGKRDARLASERLLEAARDHGQPIALHVEYDPYAPSEVLSRLMRAEGDALLIWGRPEGAIELIAGLRREGLLVPVLVPALMVLPEVAARGDALGELLGAAALDLDTDHPALQQFRTRFLQKTGSRPSYIAVFAYEAARMIVAAVEQVGLNRARIRDELARMRYDGLTGEVAFDGLGGYHRPPQLVMLRARRWVRR